MKAGADFQQAGDAAIDRNPAGGGFGDAAEDLEQGRLAGAIAANDADSVAGLNFVVMSFSAQNSSTSSPCTICRPVSMSRVLRARFLVLRASTSRRAVLLSALALLWPTK